MMLLRFLLALNLLSSWALGQLTENDVHNRRATKPNVVFILTDGQDKQMNSLQYMQTVQDELVGKGTSFDRHYCTFALCCPSRVNLLTGKMAPNTRVTDLKLPFGGYAKFISQHLNDKGIAPWMQKAGYKTYYTGKLRNDHSQKNWNKPRPAGLDGENLLVGPATVAPRANIGGGGKEGDAEDARYDDNGLSALSQGEGNAPIPAEKHKHLFPNVNVSRTDNFNPDRPSGASWIRNMPKQSAENVQYSDLYYRRCLQALQAVDDLVKDTIQRLK
ncbi:MAG: hypothetical protein Q9199_002796 [Rusavskia elegans]